MPARPHPHPHLPSVDHRSRMLLATVVVLTVLTFLWLVTALASAAFGSL